MSTDQELISQGFTRTFYQPGGPGARRYFYGVGSQYHFVGGGTIPTQGAIESEYVPDPRRTGAWRRTGSNRGTPEQASVDLMFFERYGGVPAVLTVPRCVFNLYEVHGNCADLSDFYRGWENGYMLIYSRFQFSDSVDLGARTAMDGADRLQDSISSVGESIYPIGTLDFAEAAADAVIAEVVDVVFSDFIQCTDCGIENDGSQVLYAVTSANIASPAAPGQVVYTVDRFDSTPLTSLITGIGVQQPVFIDVAGGILIVGTSAGNVFTARLNRDTGAPGAWSSVSAGMDTLADVYVKTPNDVFYAGAQAGTGRVTRTFDPTSTVSQTTSTGTANVLSAIHGAGDTIVAVGAAGTVFASMNGGETFALKAVPVAAALTGVRVISRRKWLVISSNGRMYRTTDAGSSWSEVTSFPDAGSGSLTSIEMATPEVIWVTYTLAGVASLALSLDGGNTWTRQSETVRTLNWPTFQRANRIVAPVMADPGIAANYVAVAGLASSGTDGVLFLGVPNIIW